MSKREKTLGILVAVCVVLAAGRMLYRRVSDLKQQRSTRLTTAQLKLGETRAELAVAEQAAAKLADCQRRSLPADRAIAQVLYKEWLISKLAESNITGVNVTSTTSSARSGQWQQIAFNATGRGTLEQTAKFLFAFYQADFLHKLRSFSMSPIRDSKQLELSFSIEAVALDGADNAEGLPVKTSTRLAYRTADDYVTKIGDRNLFAKYTPPAPPKPPAPPVRQEKKPDRDELDPGTRSLRDRAVQPRRHVAGVAQCADHWADPTTCAG